ncbi:MAG: tyrosine--tRNA ligase [Chlamydiae bacterium]|nr:MAG: tyrosine--tRNA ligase [Chlamydiota bacterium]
MKSIDKQINIINRGVVQICEENELREKIKKNKPLRVKLGVDPTAGELHLGFTVVLRKLRQFQDLGHQAVLIIGSYTAQVGDPSGRDKTRPQLSVDDVIANAKFYLEQAGKVLNLDTLEVCYNGDWFKKMNFLDVITMLSKSTVARTLEREDFSNRYSSGTPIYLHEFVYPLMQGYDSVMVKADVELGGTDQTFNLMVGRDLQRDAGQEPQVCITMPLLEGLDGVRKMSKSYGNYVGISDEPKDMFGKLMSISDELMWKYYELLTEIPLSEISKMKDGITNEKIHPMDVKKNLAINIISQYYDEKIAINARAAFEKVFSKGNLPDDIPEFNLHTGETELNFIKILTETKMAPSGGEVRRLIKQGAVSIDGEKISDLTIPLPGKNEFVIKIGKRRYLKIIK